MAAAAPYKFAASRRLQTPAQYAAVMQAPRARSIRLARASLSINAAWNAVDEASAVTPGASVRFGITVGKRYARRAVDRVLVKRIVREACRSQLRKFERCAASAKMRVDVALRLRSPLLDAQRQPLTVTQWRRQVRSEADELLLCVLNELMARLRPPVGASTSG